MPKFLQNGTDSTQIFPSLFIIVPNFEQERQAFREWAKTYAEYEISAEFDFYGFDLSGDDSEEIAVRNEISQKIQKLQQENSDFASVRTDSLARNRAEFYGLNGGLLFLGILLGIVFILAAVLIMYYKQISEGYEDRGRFEIMQKVGMTKREHQFTGAHRVLPSPARRRGSCDVRVPDDLEASAAVRPLQHHASHCGFRRVLPALCSALCTDLFRHLPRVLRHCQRRKMKSSAPI